MKNIGITVYGCDHIDTRAAGRMGIAVGNVAYSPDGVADHTLMLMLLAGAALDVLEGEEGIFYFDCTQRPIDNPFLLRLQSMPNVIITPHTAYYTDRALRDAAIKTIRNCLNFERAFLYG